MSSNTEFAVAVRRGANLPEETWTEERITAVVRMLPSQFQNRGDAIVFCGLAHRYDLDPFAGEIYGWDDKGKLATYVSRDGLTKKVRESDRLRDIDAQIVYAGDEFEASKDPETGKVRLHHVTRPFAEKANPIGAYCVIRGAGELPDTLVTRRMTDYSHLFGKNNWKNSKQDMLLARVISAAARLRIDLGGVYLPEDMELAEDPPRSSSNGKSASERLAALRAEAAEEEVEEAEYEIVGETDEEAEEELSQADDTTPDLPDGYEARRTGNGWYRLLGRDGLEVEDRSFRGTELKERALRDLEDASEVRAEIDEIVRAHDPGHDWVAIVNEIARDMELEETDPSRLGAATLLRIRSIVQEKIEVGTI